MPHNDVAIVGAGIIGQGWAVSFLQHGWSVAFYDTAAGAASKAAGLAREAVTALSANGATDSGHVRAFTNLGDAVADVDLIIEAVPERIDVKRSVVASIEAVASPSIPIASSTSSLLPTDIAVDMRHPERFIVAHPFNPTYLIPLVEIVPGERTDPVVTDHVHAIFTSIGKRVIRLNREIDGFVGNRLQAAIVNEAMNMVRLGIASSADIDACVSECLALRWAFFGPFETMDMNAQDGFREYAEKFGESYVELGRKLGVGEDWPAASIDAVEAGLLANSGGDSRARRFQRRDAALSALAALKRSLRE